MLWAIVIYILEAMSLMGIPLALIQAKNGPTKVDAKYSALGVLALIIIAGATLGLRIESNFSDASMAAIVIWVLLMIIFTDWIRITVAGGVQYTIGRAVWAGFSGIVIIVATSLLAFAN